MAMRVGAFMMVSCKVGNGDILPVFHVHAKGVRLRACNSVFPCVVIMNNNRPKFLALHQIRLPLPGLISILHRASGALMFLVLPVLLWMLQYSLRSIETYTELIDDLRHPV